MILRIKASGHVKKYDFFSNVNVSMSYDSVASTFSFNCYFDPDNEDHRELLHLGHYHDVTIEHNDELLITGRILSNQLEDEAAKKPASFGGYSLPGVLEDCQVPTSIYPLQFDGLNLRQIASKLIAPFRLKMVIDSSVSSRMEKVYETTNASPTQTIKSYLSSLATQRDIVISHDENGRLVFKRARRRTKPTLSFVPGGTPYTDMSVTFNGQQMHSSITVMKQPDIDAGNAGQAVVSNPYVPFTFRPKVVVQNSGDDNDTGQLARSMLAEELRNIKLTIKTNKWVYNEKILRPGIIIRAQNPDVYLYEPSNWFVQSVQLKGNYQKQEAVLTCVRPPVYDGSTPVNIFEH